LTGPEQRATDVAFLVLACRKGYRVVVQAVHGPRYDLDDVAGHVTPLIGNRAQRLLHRWPELLIGDVHRVLGVLHLVPGSCRAPLILKALDRALFVERVRKALGRQQRESPASIFNSQNISTT
jgi:transposase